MFFEGKERGGSEGGEGCGRGGGGGHDAVLLGGKEGGGNDAGFRLPAQVCGDFFFLFGLQEGPTAERCRLEEVLSAQGIRRISCR